MKILLVVPVREEKIAYYVTPPLGLGYLATALRRVGHEVAILDCIRLRLDFSGFETAVRERQPGLVGFQTFSSDMVSVRRSAEIVKGLRPDTVTVVGGPHPSGDPVGTMGFLPHVDYAFQGEGEVGLPLFVEYLEGRGKATDLLQENIPGLIWRQNSLVRRNPPAYVEDLDSLGMPSWDILRPQDYPPAPHSVIYKSYPIAPVMITRGCPFPCTFCAAHTINGRRMRRRSIPHVLEEIDLLHTTYGVNEIQIVDDNFTIDREYVRRFCSGLIERRLTVDWCCPNGVRMDTLDEELLRDMKRAGAYRIAIGIESGSQRILDHMKKRQRKEMVKEKVALIRKVGLRPHGFFILGYPEETVNDIRETIAFACELDLETAGFSLFLPLVGTEIYNVLASHGHISSDTWGDFITSRVVYTPEGITPGQLKRLQRTAFLRFYLRPKYLVRFARSISSVHNLKYLAKRALSYLF
jgi:anaerobic magnesium-protoporphyrin IX monomethyl ester cyclase